MKIGLVQINNSFTNHNYLPYSVTLLQAFVQKNLENAEDFEFLSSIYSRIPVKEAVGKLLPSDIVGFSTYVWNMQISLKIAEEIKKSKPQTIIIFGGPQVPNKAEEFLQQNDFIDITCHGEGEVSFLSLLNNIDRSDWSKVPSISYRGFEKEIMQNPRCKRISSLSEIPSPYLAGDFEPLMRANPEEEWIALWETNRGCPFSCSFCDWGSAIHNKLYAFEMDRLIKEIDWFSQHKIEFVYCCDANFGILPRDIEIIKHFAENKKKYGYPKALSVQNTKNSTETSYRIQKMLSEAGLNKGVTLSLQSLNKEVLKSVKRDNISLEVFQKLQKRFISENIETYTDVILGLPNETYNTFTKGISQIIKNGQHSRIQFNNLSALPNSELSDPAYKNKYGLVIQKTKIVNFHGSLNNVDEVFETQKLVVGTKTMPKEDWVRARVFSFMISLLHFDKVLQIPMVILHRICSFSFKEMTEIFTEDKDLPPLISEIRSFFFDKAIRIQNGDVEYCQSKEWLNIWWPADEFVLIKLCIEDKLKTFYEEASLLLSSLSKRKKFDIPQQLLKDSIYLNQNLIKLPFCSTDLDISLSYNIFEIYRGALKGTSIPVEKSSFSYRIDRTTNTWSSWKDWCREVVWYQNKKGAYLYNCRPLHEVNIGWSQINN